MNEKIIKAETLAVLNAIKADAKDKEYFETGKRSACFWAECYRNLALAQKMYAKALQWETIESKIGSKEEKNEKIS